MTIPVYIEEGTVLRLSQNVLDLRDEKGELKGGVDCGAGLGGDFVAFTWRDGEGEKHKGAIHLAELLGLFAQMVEPGAEPIRQLQAEEGRASRACPTCGREDVPLKELRNYEEDGRTEIGCTACTQEAER